MQDFGSKLGTAIRFTLIPSIGSEDGYTRSDASPYLLDEVGNQVGFVGVMERSNRKFKLVRQTYETGEIDCLVDVDVNLDLIASL